MKSIIIFVICFSTNVLFVSAQKTDNGSPVAKPVDAGVWVYLGIQIPKDLQYQIERKKEGTDKYQKIGNAEAPASLHELVNLQDKYNPFFNSLDKLNNSQLNNLWEFLQSHHTVDSMATDNLPVSHLLVGTAFFDDEAEKSVNYRYRISLVSKSGTIISQAESNTTADMKISRLPTIYSSSVRFADGRLSLSWVVKEVKDMAHFNIYRSVFGENDFKKISIEKGIYSQNDSVKLLAIDTIGNRPAWFEYKITAVDAYGLESEQQALTNGGSLQEYYAPPVMGLKAVNGRSPDKTFLAVRQQKIFKRYFCDAQ